MLRGWDAANCRLCGRNCGADRESAAGFCGMGTAPRVARAMLHHYEEPCISGKNGAGAVFFSGCSLRCVYCQNARISREGFGKDISVGRLAEIFGELEHAGAHNIDLVNPTHFVPQIAEALEQARPGVPVVYNSGGYDGEEAIERMNGLADVYLPDLKYMSQRRGKLLCNGVGGCQKDGGADRAAGDRGWPDKARRNRPSSGASGSVAGLCGAGALAVEGISGRCDDQSDEPVYADAGRAGGA